MFVLLLWQSLFSKNFHLVVLCWEPFWIILGIILEYVPLYLRAAQSFLINVCKSFLYYSNDYCTKIFFHSMSPSAGGLFEVFLVYFEDIFIYFPRNVCFLMTFCTYILDNTLMVLRLKNHKWGCCSSLGAILSF